jgi:hypothetical protein
MRGIRSNHLSTIGFSDGEYRVLCDLRRLNCQPYRLPATADLIAKLSKKFAARHGNIRIAFDQQDRAGAFPPRDSPMTSLEEVTLFS